jgi:hypothetical protein
VSITNGAQVTLEGPAVGGGFAGGIIAGGQEASRLPRSLERTLASPLPVITLERLSRSVVNRQGP